MFTLSVNYLFIYFQLLILIFFYLYIYINIVNIQKYSVATLLHFIKNYTLHWKFFFFLLLLLSGLPPVSFFIIKLIFLLNIFVKVEIILQILFFFNFLFGIYFYLQFFNITIIGLNLQKENLINTTNNFNNLKLLGKNNSKYTIIEYNYWIFYNISIFLNIFYIFFFFDMYSILSIWN